MKDPASPVANLLSTLEDVLINRLGENLVGLYAYGSVFEATFDPVRSDVDCIAVTGQPLTADEFRRLDDDLAQRAAADAWFDRLQLSLLIRDAVLSDDPRACLYQFGELTRSGSDGNPLVWMDVLQRGGVLFGAETESFLPEITPGVFREALVREVGYLREELITKPKSKWRDKPTYRIYAVLTLCRILYSARTGGLASKAGAGKWALSEVSSRWHPLIRKALGAAGAEGEETLDLSDLWSFIEDVGSEIDSRSLVTPTALRRGPLADALSWLVGLLRDLKVQYQVVGGLAARAHGATRALVDIDLYVPDSALATLGVAAEPWVKRPATHHVDQHWDLTFMSLVRDGWTIEIAASDSAFVWDGPNGRWVSAGIDFEAGEVLEMEGIQIRVMPKDQLVAYKKGLGRGVDRMDLEEL